MQLVVFRILWMRLIVVDEIPVKIDIFLGNAPQPGETMTVQGMDEHEAQVVGQVIRLTAIEKAGEDAGATKALNTMGCGIAQKDIRRVAATEKGDVRVNWLSVGPAGSCAIGGDFRSCFCGRG